MLCLKKRRTYSFTQGACQDLPRRTITNKINGSSSSAQDHHHHHHHHRCFNNNIEALNMTVTTLPRKLTKREDRSSAMVLTVTEDTPADMLAGSMELIVQMPREHQVQTQRVTVQRSTPMMDLLVQIATAHKLAASSYTLQAIGERGLVLPHQPNTPIGALDALQVKLLPKQGTFLSRKSRQNNQPFETTFRLQVHLPRNQLYVSRVSPKTNLGEILDEVCREKNLDRNKYELRHPANHEEVLDLSLSLQDYNLQQVDLYAKRQSRSLSSALSSQDIMALQKQEECRRQNAKHSFFGFVFNKNKGSSLSTDSLGNRSSSPARSDSPIQQENSTSRLQSQQQQQQQYQKHMSQMTNLQSRPHRKRRPAPKPPVLTQQQSQIIQNGTDKNLNSKNRNNNKLSNQSNNHQDSNNKDKVVISHSRNSSDSSGYHEASVLSDNPDSNNAAGRNPETLPRRGKMQDILESPRQLAQTAHASKSLGNLAMSSNCGTLSRGISNTSLSSAGQRKKRAAPPPPMARTLPSAISHQGLERIVDSDESLTSDMDLSKPSSDIVDIPSKASSDITPVVSNKSNMLKESNKIQKKSKTLDNNVESARVVKRDKSISTTDILLQKVSDTLSSSLGSPPPSPPPSPEDSGVEIPSLSSDDLKAQPKNYSKSKGEIKKNKDHSHDETKNLETLVTSSGSVASTTNVIVHQDTSDYVSTNGEDLSINDWEYQIPAPPNGFRDENDEEVISSTVKEKSSFNSKNIPKNSSNVIESPKIKFEAKETKTKQDEQMNHVDSTVDSVDYCPKIKMLTSPVYSESQHISKELKKEVISELESKIESRGNQKISNDVNTYYNTKEEAKIAPVDNTLSNFTITTYSKPKSLDIFEQIEQQNEGSNKVINAFATLARGKSETNKIDDGVSKTKIVVKNTRPTDHQTVLNLVRENGREKAANVHRSKSYIILSSNEKFQNHVNINGKIKEEIRFGDNVHIENGKVIKKSTSITNINESTNNETMTNREKFSQWRENILKKHEETNQDTQLQSLQVLKTILPRLRSAQSLQETVEEKPKENSSISTRKSPETSSITEEHEMPKSTISEVKLRQSDVGARRAAEPEKRYTYAGPPAISLSSWTERPKVNVQIKTDTDYKFGGSKNSASGARTVVNLNGSNGISVDGKLNIKTNKEEPKIDTTSVKFSDLTKTFGSDVRLRPKSTSMTRINSQNRHSEFYERKPEIVKQNGISEPIVTSTTSNNNRVTVPIKRYTSVVGINGGNYNETKVHAPILKSFSADTKQESKQKSVSKEYIVPKPPTMPVITGVTLKSANSRPLKPLTIQTDPRDQLLESIRSFGGSANLKKALGRR